MKNPRFTQYNDYPYDYLVKRALENGTITRADHDLLIEYIEDKISKGEIELARAQRLATALTQWRRFIRTPYNKMTYKQLLAGTAALRQGTNKYGRPFAQGTVRHLLKAMKTFTRWMIRKGIVKITRDELDEIKYPKEKYDSVKSGDILSPEDVEKIIGTCRTVRDKAIISIAADTDSGEDGDKQEPGAPAMSQVLCH